MIKRVLIIFTVIVMVVLTMVVPAFASEVQGESSIKIVKQPSDVVRPINADGSTCYVSLSIVVEGDVSSYQWQLSKDNGKTWSNVSGGNGHILETYINAKGEHLFRCVITGADGSVVVSRKVTVEYGKARILRFASSALEFVVDWVSSVVDSLVSPNGALYPLLPILAIGIAVTAVLLVIKIFKSFSWGL